MLSQHDYFPVHRVFQNVCRIPGIIQLLIELGNSYNITAVFSILLQQMIPLAIHVNDSQHTGDEPSHYFTFLLELLQTVDFDSALTDTVVRFVSALFLLRGYIQRLW